MRFRISRWVRLLFGGALLLAAPGSGCLAGALRDLSADLDEWADDVADEEESLGDVIDDWLD